MPFGVHSEAGTLRKIVVHLPGLEQTRLTRPMLRLAEAQRLARYVGTETKRPEGKEVALVFEKTSTRTRSAFEVASHDRGDHVTYLDPSGS